MKSLLRSCFGGLWLCGGLLVSATAQAEAQQEGSSAVPEVVVGMEQIDYYPHYDFSAGRQRGYFFDLMQLFGHKAGYRIVFRALPVKRLYQEAAEGVDLVYPDNPLWQQYLVADYPKVFSDPVVFTLGSTMVLPQHRQISLHRFRSLAVIHGFVPHRWLELREQHNFRIIDVPDAASALGLVLKGRVQGAVVELNVAHDYLQRLGQPGALVAAEQLPFTEVPFLLSTVRKPELITRFNLFLRQHAGEIAALKRSYGLIEHKSELPPVVR